MRLIVDLFTIFTWVLIQIGDAVLLASTILLKPFIHKKTHIKPSAVLFKAHKKRRKKFFTVATLLRWAKAGILRPIVFVVLIALFLVFFVFRQLYKTSIFLLKQGARIFSKAVHIAVKLITAPFILVYKWDKKNKEAFYRRLEERWELEKKIKYRRKPTLWYSIKVFLWGTTFAALFIFIPLLSLIFLSDLPNPNRLASDPIAKTTKIYDRNGELLYEIFANQNRTVVPLSQIPKDLQHATIAIEDRDFYTHPGFDIRGIARAFFSNSHSNDLQGGSTITQQLIKSALLTPDPTIERKMKEIILAFWAERLYSKNTILGMYFNYVPYGGSAWGVQAASEAYFGKAVKDLDLAQSAFLAGLPRAPSVYSPYSNTGTLWKSRQKEVLTAMVKMHFITQNQADNASREKLTFVGPDVGIKAPHFVMFVKNLLIQKYGISTVERGGLQVKTTLDLKTQQMAQDIVKHEVEGDAGLNISNGASLILDPRNGDILAMVGSRDYFDTDHDGNVNLTTSLRQPGSTIKVVTYSLALSSGFTQATLLEDSPLTITPAQGPAYTPVNYDGSYHGKLPLRLAFANSLNIPAVRVAQKLGVDNIVAQGKRLGITTWDDSQNYGLSITLGAADTTMLDLATVYGTVANSGKRVDSDPFLEIQDANGQTIYKKQPQESQVLDPGVAYIISDILSDNKARSIEFGANSPLNIPGHRISVKTGTTDNKRDNWTVGFTPNIVVATWVGNNDNSPMSQALASGITGAAPMWNQIMNTILSTRPEGPVLIPDDVVTKQCMGFTMSFLKGTENTSCVYAPYTPTPTNGATALAR